MILNYGLGCDQLIYQAKQLGITMYTFPDICPQKTRKRHFSRGVYNYERLHCYLNNYKILVGTVIPAFLGKSSQSF